MKILQKYVLLALSLFAVNSWGAWHQQLATPEKVDGVYQIGTPEELAGFAQLTNDSEPDAKGVLTADLVFGDDIDSYSCESVVVGQWPACSKFNSIGQGPSKPFTGTLDGNGHIIYGLFGYGDMMALGLIGTLGEGGVVKNLTLVKPMFANPRSYAGDNNYFSLGGVVGTNYGTVLNCHVIDASIDAPFSGNYYHSATGGVVGINGDENHQNAKVLNCSSSGTIVGRYVGGVVGWNNYGIVSSSYSTATVIGKTEGDENAEEHTLDSTYAGGIIGYNATNAVLEYSVYYGGDIRLTDDGWKGSLIGNGGEGSVVEKSYYEDPDGPGAGNCAAGPTTCSFDGTDIETLQDEDKQALIDTLNKTANKNCEANSGSDCDVPAWNVENGEIISTGADKAQNTADGYITLQIDNDITKGAVVISGKKDGISVMGGTAFDKNTEITVTLTLLNGAVFQKWTNALGDSIGNSNPYTFTISSNTYLKTNFAEPPETETIVVQYGENASDTIEVVVPVSADSAARVEAVNEAFENHNPAIPAPQKTDGSADSTYTFTGFEPDENGVYQPTFEAEEKTETIVVQYGENATDTIEVVVPVSADSAARVEAVNEAFENHNPAIPAPQKTDGSADSTYTFTGFEPDENGVYQPTFEAEEKNETIVAQYGENASDTIEVVVPVSADSAARVEAVNEAFENHNPAIPDPQKTDGSADSTYTFTGFEPDENGVYQPVFEAEVKTETIVAQYGENASDTIEVVVPVSADSAARVEAVNEAFENHNPAIPDPQKTDGSADSTYTFTGFEPDENGVYQPVFEAEEKTTELVVVYGGDPSKDVVHITVPVTLKDSAARVTAVTATLAARGITPMKTGEDSTYTFDHWSVDGDNYTAEFKSTPKYIEVVVGEDTVKVNVPAEEGESGQGDDVAVEIKVVVDDDTVTVSVSDGDVLDSIIKEVVKEDPTKTGKDSTYEFTGWEPSTDSTGKPVADENGNPIYEPAFDAEVKKDTMVIAYGDGEDERIDVVVPVTSDANDRLDAIDSALAAQNPPVEVKKTNGSDDSTYTYIGWQTKIDKDSNVVVDEKGNPVYEPVFEATVKTTELVVVYGGDPSKDVVHITVPVTLKDSAARVQLVLDSLAAWKISPSKAETDDSTYTFDHWSVDGDNYTAEFKSTPKYIEVVVGEDTVKVNVPAEEGESGQGDDVAVEIKVVVDDDTVTVSVSDGDVLDSIIKEVVKEDPTKTGKDSTYEFTGWEPSTDSTGKPVADENGNPIYEPAFDAEVKKDTIIVAVEEDLVEVVIFVTDSDDDVQKKIEKVLETEGVPTPTKQNDEDAYYKFDKFVKNEKTGVYEPSFKKFMFEFKITFVLPEKGELLSEFDTYTFGKETILPGARIIDDDGWEFKGWYTEENGLGIRCKKMLPTDEGDKVFYPLFQKTISYKVNDESGDIEIIYSANAETVIERALERVIPADYEEKGKTFTFSKWVLKDGVYTAKFTEATGIRGTEATRFNVVADGRSLEIVGARTGAHIAVFDIRGNKVVEDVVANGAQRINLSIPGCYLVKVDNQVSRVVVR